MRQTFLETRKVDEFLCITCGSVSIFSLIKQNGLVKNNNTVHGHGSKHPLTAYLCTLLKNALNTTLSCMR